MSCDYNTERISAYIDDVLPAAERAEVERHLASCPVCRALLASLQNTIAAVRSLPAVEPPEGFSAGLRERLLAHAANMPGEAASPSPSQSGRVVALNPRPAAETSPAPTPARQTRRGTRWSRFWPAAAAAAVALVVGWSSAWLVLSGGMRLPGMTLAGTRASDLAANGMSAAEVAASGTRSVSEAAAAPPEDGSFQAGSTSAIHKSATEGTGGATGPEGAAVPPFVASSFATAGPLPDRLPIARSAHVRVRVTNIGAGYARVLQEIATFQGEIITAEYAGSEATAASLDLRVPADRLDGLLASLSQAGKLVQNDVVGEDMSAALRTLDQEAQKLLERSAGAEQVLGAEVGGGEGGGGGATSEDASPAEELARIRDQQSDLQSRIDWAKLVIVLEPAGGR